MFRPIKERLQTRLVRLSATQAESAKLRRATDEFVAGTKYSKLRYELVYKPGEYEVTINVEPKTAVHELVLRAHQLSALFREHKLKVKRVVIR